MQCAQLTTVDNNFRSIVYIKPDELTQDLALCFPHSASISVTDLDVSSDEAAKSVKHATQCHGKVCTIQLQSRMLSIAVV